MIVETNRLILRRFQKNDIDTFLKYRNDPLVAKFQSWEINLDKEAGEKFIKDMMGIQLDSDGQWKQIAIETKHENIHIGDCSIKIYNRGTEAEVGITLDKAYWGKGYAYECLTGLFDFGFNNLGIHRIVALTDTLNTNSIKLLNRLGMRREAHFIESYFDKDSWTDEYLFAVLEKEWA